jgi:hypothetical protein
MVVDWIDCGMAGGKDFAGRRIRVYRGYFAGVDRVCDWRMDFHAAGDFPFEYVFVFVGRGNGGSGATGGGGTFVFWGEEVGGI